jgi:uncharacterized protein (TIGR00369 family)
VLVPAAPLVHDEVMSVHHRKLEAMYLRAPINVRLYSSATIEIGEGIAAVELDVKDDYFHAAGATHGSVFFKLLDDAAFFAVASLVDDRFVVTASFNTYITRPVSGGRLRSEGKVVHAGKTMFVAESVIRQIGDPGDGSQGKELARGSGTFMKSSIALSEKLGYL